MEVLVRRLALQAKLTVESLHGKARAGFNIAYADYFLDRDRQSFLALAKRGIAGPLLVGSYCRLCVFYHYYY